MGGLLAPLGPAVPFWVAMLVALANALLVLRFLPETRRTESACATVPFTNRGMGGVLAGWRRCCEHSGAECRTGRQGEGYVELTGYTQG